MCIGKVYKIPMNYDSIINKLKKQPKIKKGILKKFNIL